jgi:hypothetical protein
LVQNLLYGISQITIPFNTVEAKMLSEPQRWQPADVGRFMLLFGTPKFRSCKAVRRCEGFSHSAIRLAVIAGGCGYFRKVLQKHLRASRSLAASKISYSHRRLRCRIKPCAS